MSQDELADAIGRSVETLANIERGFSAPRIKTAMEIATTFGVTFTDIIRMPPGNAREAHHQQAIDRLHGITQNCDERTLAAVVEAVEFTIGVADRPGKG